MSTNSNSTAYTYQQAQNAWIQAGGNPQAAAMAAAVADAESGLNTASSRQNPDGTTSIGLWGVPQNGMPPGSTDPIANARAAVQLSNNGTDWTQWCSTWSDNNCGENGGQYLASGSNALAALGQRLSPSSYNVIGSHPSGSGAGASSATQLSTTTGTQNSNYSLILVLGLVLLVGIAVYMIRKNRVQQGQPEQAIPRDQ